MSSGEAIWLARRVAATRPKGEGAADMEREGKRMSELQGQTDIRDYLPEEGKPGTAVAEGYDAEGRLMDYVPEGTADAGTSSDPADGGATFPMGEGFGASTQAPADVMSSERLTAIAAEVRTIEEQVRGVALSGAVAIGRRLIEAKSLVPHGRFLEWLAANLSYSERRAQDLMRLYETYGQGTIPESVSALDYSKAVALLGAPEDQREQLAARAIDEDMSVRELQAEVKRLKKEAEVDQLTIDELERQKAEDAETARLAIERMGQDVDAMRGTAEAASQTAEALRQEKQAARREADLANQKARDATQRANETQRQLTEAQRKIGELEAREPERVEVVPEEVQAELERLRSQRPRGEAEVRFRLAFERLGAEFRAVTEILAEVNREDADKGAQFAQAVATTCKRMVEMLGVEA